jgi:hypothetical protein
MYQIAAKYRPLCVDLAPHQELSAFDVEILADQMSPYPVAEIALQLDAIVNDSSAGAAETLQLGAQFLQKRFVAREVEHDGHRFAAAPFFLEAEFGNRTRRDRLRRGRLVAAAALAFRPSAPCADPAAVGGVDDSGIGHARMVATPRYTSLPTGITPGR